MKIDIISLDARPTADLNWKEFLAAAANCKQILWEIDLGLLDQDRPSLTDPLQFRTLSLALDYFVETFFYPFQKATVGVALLRGSLPFVEQRELADYLQLLSGQLPEELPLFILVDGTAIADPIQRARLLLPDLFFPISCIVKGSFGDPLLWQDGGIDSQQLPPLAIALPAADRWTDAIEKQLSRAASSFEARSLSYRLIPEPLLPLSWEGLEELVVLPEVMTPSGERQLQGFAAAGGIIHILH